MKILQKQSLFSIVFLFCSFFAASPGWSKADIEFNKTIVLDADTANEVDDIYAIVAALNIADWNIVALNATQWQTSHWTSPNAMEDSHRLNQVIVGYMGTNTPTKRGGVARMYDWGDKAQHSAAAYEIIKQAKTKYADTR